VRWLVVHDYDLHGFACGVAAAWALMRRGHEVALYSDYGSRDLVLEALSRFDFDALAVLDLAPRGGALRLLCRLAAGKPVVVADHHEWAPGAAERLRERGARVLLTGSAYEVALFLPRLLGAADGFAEEWALVGAVADFDRSVAPRVPPDLEVAVCERLDRAFKERRGELLPPGPAEFGNVGSHAYAVAAAGVRPAALIERAKGLAPPLEVPHRPVGGRVALALAVLDASTVWKAAWKLSVATGLPVAVAPARHGRERGVAVAVYWRAPAEVLAAVEGALAGRELVGRPGARVVLARRTKVFTLATELADEIAEELEGVWP